MSYRKPRQTIINEIERIINIQFAEISASITQAKCSMLPAVGCMNAIEFLGGIYTGELGVKSKVEYRFKQGARLLGKKYLLFGVDNMYLLRNSLTHQYGISIEHFPDIWLLNDSDVRKWDDMWPPYKIVNGIHTRDAIMIEGDTLWINVVELLKDIKIAWGCVKKELSHNDLLVWKAEISLDRLPKLGAL